MSRTSFAKAVLTATLLALSTAASASEAAVRSAFDQYRHSVMQNDGRAAMDLVSQSTLDYYGVIHQLALRANSDIIRQANIGDRLLILMVRHRIEPDVLTGMDGEALFVHAVNEGWIGKNGVEKLEVGSVAMRDTTARAIMVASGKPTPIHITLKKEGDWRVDLTSILPVTNQAFGQAVKRMGMSENDFILLTLDSLTGKTVPDTIWDPVVR